MFSLNGTATRWSVFSSSWSVAQLEAVYQAVRLPATAKNKKNFFFNYWKTYNAAFSRLPVTSLPAGRQAWQKYPCNLSGCIDIYFLTPHNNFVGYSWSFWPWSTWVDYSFNVCINPSNSHDVWIYILNLLTGFRPFLASNFLVEMYKKMPKILLT